VLWRGSYTDKDSELRGIKQPTLIVWVPVDQVHPVSLGRHYKEEFPNNQMIELKVGAFKPEKCRHCYEACSEQVVPAIVGWLRARFAD
jgi:pimeloyl-ACP methyl ester carboxylesterase